MVRVNVELPKDRKISFDLATGFEGLEDMTPAKDFEEGLEALQ